MTDRDTRARHHQRPLRWLLFLVGSLFVITASAAQPSIVLNAAALEAVQPGELPSNPAPAAQSEGIYTKPQALSSNEFWLSTMVMVLGCVALGLAFVLLRTRRISADDMIRLISIILIIIGTMFLITASFTAEQIAPAMGLFGTIAGYLLGKASGSGQDAGSNRESEKGKEE